MFGKFSYDGLFIDDFYFEKEKFQEYTMNKNNNFKKCIKCISVCKIIICTVQVVNYIND